MQNKLHITEKFKKWTSIIITKYVAKAHDPAGDSHSLLMMNDQSLVAFDDVIG